MLKIPFNEKLEIEKDLCWGMLKYGYCSYFALAFSEVFPNFDRFLAVMEFDKELKKEYLVHFLIVDKHAFVDAYGSYSSWNEAVKDIEDIEYMELVTYEVEHDFIRERIQMDMGFDKEVYEVIRKFIENIYTLEPQKSIG